MTIILKPEQEQLIQAKVTSGKYTTVDEVIAEALQLLDQRDKHYQKWVEDTREKVAVGLAQLDRGEGIELQISISSKNSPSQRRKIMSICLISPKASQDLDEIFDYFASRNIDAYRCWRKICHGF